MSTSSTTSEFMFFLRHPASGPGPSPEELQQIMQRFGGWMQELAAKNALIGSNGLEDAGKILREPGGARLTDGPYAETKEIIGGYIHVRADNLAAAVELARGCPGLDYRLAVEVRAIRPRPEA